MQFRSHKEEIKEIAAQEGIVIRKKQGQCFLINDQVANFIIDVADLNSNYDRVLEIGPGFGSLTSKLVNNSRHLYAIEIDRKICVYLTKKFRACSNLELINKDVMKVDFPTHDKLISNVPYHISGPLLQKIALSNEKAELIVLMLQQEFINRMKTSPQPKGYGRVSVISQLCFDIKNLRNVSRFDFYPQPEVESGIILLKFKPKFKDNPFLPYFIEFLAGIFPYKNKILPKSLSFLRKTMKNYPKLLSLEGFSLDIELPLELKNKRLWQLKPLEIWEIFEILRNA